MSESIQISEIKLTQEEIDAAVAVLKSGALRQGKRCAEFEAAFAGHVGARHALTCSSGTAALHLAYLSFLKPGDEVLVPSCTFFATGSMVTMSGGHPVFCDVDPETWLIDLKDAEKKITARTKAIAPVHLFGNPCPVNEIERFAVDHGLTIVWDAAQAHGARFNGKDVGSFGDLACYSFYPSKNMFTGEGGMVTTNSPELLHSMELLRSHGESGRYYHTMIGFNYRMTDMEAAIGVEQLKRLDGMLAVRRRNASILSAVLSGTPGVSLQRVVQGGEHSYHQYCILIDEGLFGMDRDALAERLREKGVATGVHYPRGLHEQPVFEELYGRMSLPVTEDVCRRILAIPVHHGMTEKQAEYVAASIREEGQGGNA